MKKIDKLKEAIRKEFAILQEGNVEYFLNFNNNKIENKFNYRIRNISLEYILLFCIKNKMVFTNFDSKLYIFDIIGGIENGIDWDLSKPLEYQKEGTIDFFLQKTNK